MMDREEAERAFKKAVVQLKKVKCEEAMLAKVIVYTRDDLSFLKQYHISPS